MPRKTRKIKQNSLGEGFHGKAYNLGCKPDGQSICSILEGEDIQKITIYTADKKKVKLTGDDIREFLRYIHTAKNKIGKIFKNIELTTGASTLSDFESEIHDNLLFLKIYGRQSAKYLTIVPDTGFRGLPVLGAYFDIPEKETIYMVFGTKCNNHYKMNFEKFIIDMLESIIILYKGGYRHNDIKLDNVVLCKDRYKLIDFGQSTKSDKTELGDPIASSPMLLYMMGYQYYLSRNFMKLRAEFVDFPYANSEIFNEVYERILREFDDIVPHVLFPYTLIDMYKDSLDVFAISMTKIHAIFRYEIKKKKYRPLIYTFTSLIAPMNPVQALAFSKKFFKSL
jgi:serine/threonine protein kinase